MSTRDQIAVPDSICRALRMLMDHGLRHAVERVARARAWCRGAFRAQNGCRCFDGHVGDWGARGPRDLDAWNVIAAAGVGGDFDRFAESVGTRAAAEAVREEAERLLA